MFQQTLDGSARGWFERLPRDSINEWANLREAFAARYSVKRACLKEPREITKIVRKANESLTTFKERWTVEMGFIMDVSEVMKISSFMDAVKSPELAKRFSNKVPATVNEMMERLDDLVRSEKAYANTELRREKWGRPIAKRLFHSTERTIGRFGILIRETHEGMIIETITEEEMCTLRAEQEITGLHTLLQGENTTELLQYSPSTL
ncbi:reverse transcriptase domain-containing protein [Tanacetum coccineum]